MAKPRVLVKRRKSVRNIRKITRTMQLIATARFQAALNRATATKPYADKLAELIADLSQAAEQLRHPLMTAHDHIKRSALIVLTSNRGLCGGYNANVLRTAVAHLDEMSGAEVDVDVHMVGKKGVNYFRFLGRPTKERTTAIGDSPKFEQVEPIANMMMDRFLSEEIDVVYVAYMQFHSVGKQQPVVMPLLPLTRELLAKDQPEEKDGGPAVSADFEFSPEPQALLDELLPATVRVRLFQCFTDAVVSEQISRMVAMKAATDAAGEMIKQLTQQYNRARQTQITMELLDIIGGANALS